MSVILKSTNIIKTRLGLEENGRVQKFLTNTCAIHMDKYVPFDTGTTAETVVINKQANGPGVADDRVTYQTPYAKIIYKGVRGGKDINYHTDKHPQAGPYWDRRMVSAEIDKVIKEVEKYIKIGGK